MDRNLLAALDHWTGSHDGIITSTEVRALGGDAGTARALVAAGHWDRLGRGIFRDRGHPWTARSAHRVALAAAGGSGVLSHGSAAWVQGMVDRPPDAPVVTVPVGRSARVATRVLVEVHHTRRPPPSFRERGLPVTGAARTLVDLAATTAPTALDPLLDRALARHLLSPAYLGRELADHDGRPGVAGLARHLEARGALDAPGVSVLEAMTNRLLVRLHRDEGLPLPEQELRVSGGRYRLDYAWADVDLCLEVDGGAYHGPDRRVHDTDRRSALTAGRWTFLTFDWYHVTHRPEVVGDRILSAYHRMRALRC